MKDAKGHGSNKRDGILARLDEARANPNHPLGVLSRVVSQGTPIAGIPATELARGNPKAQAAPVHSGFSMKVSAYENPVANHQDYQERTYSYKGGNRKAGINWALKKAHREFPNHRNHSVEIID